MNEKGSLASRQMKEPLYYYTLLARPHSILRLKPVRVSRGFSILNLKKTQGYCKNEKGSHASRQMKEPH